MRRMIGLTGLVLVIGVVGSPRDALAQEPMTLDTPYAPPGYQRILKQHVVRVPLEGGGFETRFDYLALADHPESATRRERIRRGFLSVDPEGMDAEARYAWAVNAYNFLVIDLIVENTTADLPPSISKLGAKPFAVFDKKRYEVAGTKHSLNSFERRYVFLDVNRKTGNLPEGLDPRLHFALVCAARGCPSLWPEPFHPERLHSQLEAATRNALRSPAHLRVDGNTIHLSKIFEWYAVDFGGEPGVLAFLRNYAPQEVQDLIEHEDARTVTDIEWDWSLNHPD